MERLVCADGGNLDPTSTHDRKPDEAKRFELAGWDYPKHLAGRAYGVIVHGDVACIEGPRGALTDWLDWMGFVASGVKSRLERFIDYYEPYATSHAALDQEDDMQKEVVNVARAITVCVNQIRKGRKEADENLMSARMK